MKKRRINASVNAGSMADIAFLLLIFFLVTTTITQDSGISIKLPPFVPNQEPTPLNEDNVFTVKVNKENQLLVETEYLQLAQLRERTKAFIMNPNGLENLPSNPKNAIISLQNDRQTSYETYVEVYNELKGAYNELWNAAAQSKYQVAYVQLPKSQQNEIRKQIPLVISEAEPSEY
ncbi:MAG: ExbD/TolR family protein [Saprospiraceae bacterium]